MPMHEFKCSECGLKFEDLVDEDQESIECKSCGAEAEKSISGFGFQFDSGKMEDGTIGVDSVDNDVDKVIGRDADERWERVKDRESKKRKVARKRADDEDAPVKRDPEGKEYDVIPEDEQLKNAWLHEQRKEFEEQNSEEVEEDSEESSRSEE